MADRFRGGRQAGINRLDGLFVLDRKGSEDTMGKARASFYLVVWGMIELSLPLNTFAASSKESNNACALKQVYDSVQHLGHVCDEATVRKRALAGHLFEQNQLGIAAVLDSTARSGEAVFWFEKAARKGYGSSQANLGLLYLFGWGAPPNYPRALYYLRLAADQGIVSANFGMGFLFAHGKGVQTDYAEAVRYFLAAANKNYAPAQASLAYHYELGLGVEQDLQKAASWYRKAAENGDAQAQRSLAHMYVYGIGVKPDEKEAFKWSQKAAKQGDLEARVNLAYMFLNGKGTAKDLESAYIWLKAATADGFEGGKTDMDRIEQQLSSEQIARAQIQISALASKQQQALVALGQ